MMKKTIFVLLLMVVIFSTSALADYCGGTRRCHCGDWLVESQVMWYDLINCPDEGLRIWADNITLDCNNHLIDGIRTYYSGGIHIIGQENTVTNCNAQEFYYGIIIAKGSSHNIIAYNTVNDNSHTGIYLADFTDNSVLYDNNILNNEGYGILVFGVYNDIYRNTFVNNSINAHDDGAFSNWNLSNGGNYWSDFPSNPGYPDYYEIPGSGNGIDWHPIWEWPDVWIDLTPLGNITFPPTGGILEYNISGGNNENTAVRVDIWVDVTIPNGSTYRPILGPLYDFFMPVGFSTSREKTLRIPATAPAGIYSLNGYVGAYRTTNPIIYAEDHFDFIKVND